MRTICARRKHGAPRLAAHHHWGKTI
jgi:hypothetical protein